MVMFGALLGPEGLHVCVVSWWRVRPWWYTAPGVGVGAAGVVGSRAYVENCIVDASIFEFLWSSC